MSKLDDLIKSGDLIGPIIVEPRVDRTPPEFKAVGEVYQAALDLSPRGDSYQFRRELRREFHRLLDVTINEVHRKGELTCHQTSK